MNLDSSLRENRVFAPPAEFAAKAHVKSLEEYEAMYRRSVEAAGGVLGERRRGSWTGSRRGRKVLDGPDGAADAKWFVGGKLNLSHNCVDRHALGARKDKVALLWEGEPGEVRKLTYGELHEQVQRFANVLKGLRNQDGRPRRHLHGHVSRAGDCAAGLRAHRRGAFGDLRRVCGACDRRTA